MRLRGGPSKLPHAGKSPIRSPRPSVLKDSLEVTDAELHIEPIRFWLATFKRARTDEAFYAVVLQDGTIVEAQDRRESLKL
jgi:hypothetical protein